MPNLDGTGYNGKKAMNGRKRGKCVTKTPVTNVVFDDSTKKWYESKTLWINFLSIVSGVLLGVQGLLVEGGVITTMGIVNILLRTITKQNITL